MPSFTYTKVTAAYKFGNGLTPRAGITNLFDKAPPVDMGTYGGTGTTPYNPSLHQIGGSGGFGISGTVRPTFPL